MAITNTMLEFGIEPYDKDWGTGTSGLGDGNFSPFERINKIRNKILDTPHTIDEKRAVIWTEAMQNNTEASLQVRCALAFREVLRKAPLYINENMILGDMAAPPRCAPIYPEFSFDWIIDEFDNAPFNERSGDRFEYTKETEQKIKAIYPYWKGKTVHNLIKSLTTEEQLKGEAQYGEGMFFPGNYFSSGVGHCSPRFELMLEIGWKGIKEKVLKAQASLDPSTPEGVKKNDFYKAQLIGLDAVTTYIQRYAAAVMNDYNRAAARSGVGAVMGSKNVKAVVLRGAGRKAEVADPDGLAEVAKKWRETLAANPITKGAFQALGTSMCVSGVNSQGGIFS